MILFIPWPVQKYITTHLYIIAEFEVRGKLSHVRASLHALRVNTKLLRTSLALCALFQNCSALRAPAILRGIHTSPALCALFQNCSALRAPAILRGIHTPACRPSCSCRVIPSNALHAASKLSHVRA